MGRTTEDIIPSLNNLSVVFVLVNLIKYCLAEGNAVKPGFTVVITEFIV